jgi:hypothetical protein
MTSAFNGPFLAIPRWAIEKVLKNPSSLQVVCSMVDHMDIRTKQATVSVTQLCEATGLTRRTVQRAVRWLESEGVVATKMSGAGASSYTLMYEGGASPMTQGGVTHDAGGASPMTQGGVTHDAPRGVKNGHLPGLVGNTIEVRESIKEESERVFDPEGGKEVIIGGDHEEEAKKERRHQIDATNKSSVKPLVQRFLTHPSQFRKPKPTEAETLVLRRAIRLLLEGGMSSSSVAGLIDLFMDSHFVQYDDNIRAFASKKIQAILIKKLQVSVIHEDPVLQYLSLDCQRGDLDLPWSPDQDQMLQNALMRRALESTFRYPELVSQVIHHWAGGFSDSAFVAALDDLESIVKHGLGMTFVDIPETAKRLTMVSLPKDLLKGTVRASPGTMVSAVYESRRSPNA